MTKPTKRAQARQDASDILILATYREIQTSGNPLQDYELRILVNRYPTRYGVLRRFLPEFQWSEHLTGRYLTKTFCPDCGKLHAAGCGQGRGEES